MPPKAAPTTAIVSRSADVQNTSMADTTTINNSLDRAWFKNMLQQLTVNQKALKAKLNAHNHQPVKMPSVEKFTEDRVKLKGFLTQIKM